MNDIHGQAKEPTRKKAHWYSKPKPAGVFRFLRRKESEANVEPEKEEQQLKTVASVHSAEETPVWEGDNSANSPFFSSPQNPPPGNAVSPIPGLIPDNRGAVRPEVVAGSQPNSGFVQVNSSTEAGTFAPKTPSSPNPEYRHHWATRDGVIKPIELADTTVPQTTTPDAEAEPEVGPEPEPEAEPQGPVFELGSGSRVSDLQDAEPTELAAASPVDNTMGCLGRDRGRATDAGRFSSLPPALPHQNSGADYMAQEGAIRAFNQAASNQTINPLYKNFQTNDGSRAPPRPRRPGDPMTYHGDISQPSAIYKGQSYHAQRYSPHDEMNSNAGGFQGGEAGRPRHQSFSDPVQQHYEQTEFDQPVNSESKSRFSLAPLKRLMSSRGDEELQKVRKVDPHTHEWYEGLSSDWEIIEQLLHDYNIPKARNRVNLPPLSRVIQWSPQQLRQLKSEIDSKDEEVKQKDSQIKSQETEITELKGSLNSMTNAHAIAHNKWVDTKAKLDESAAKVNGLERALNEALGKIKNLEIELASDKNALIDSISECDTLHQKNIDREAEWVDWHAEKIKIHNEQAKTKGRAYQKEIDRLNLAAIQTETEHNNEVEKMEGDHAATLQTMKASHEMLLKKETTELKDRLGSLQRHMAGQSSTGGYLPIPDDEFRSMFMGLARRINNLIAYVPRPESFSLDSSLDPSGFLLRNMQQGGRNWPKFIRNVCWRTIVKGFYSRQLGFGAFGPQGSPGFDFLDQTFQLSCIASPEGENERPRIMLNDTDRRTDVTGLIKIWPNTSADNIYRAGFFKAISRAAHDKTRSQESTCYLRFFNNNVIAVTNELVSILLLASQNHLSSQATTEVAGIVEGFGLLALDMGSQRAHVYVESCQYGEVIKAGDLFVDETEHRSGGLTVDLMTQPSVRRVGDGREDLKLQRAIVKGDFIALKTG